MADPYVREVGSVTSLGQHQLRVGVDYDTVTVAGYLLNAHAAEEFAQLFTAACWEAAANGERMRQEQAGG
jgi:hypothetical protein